MSAIFGWPLGWIMYFFYSIVPIYGVALLLFTLFTKICMVPLSIKQQRSLVKNQLFQPKILELQKKYANNKEKLNIELQKLYTEEGYNPMSGCLPILIQFPIVIGLYNVIQRPLTHLLRMPAETIESAASVASTLMDIPAADFLKDTTVQIRIIGQVHSNPEAFSALGDFAERVLSLKLSLGPIDLTQMPQLSEPNVLWIIPILSAATALILSLITGRQTSSSDNPAAANTQRTMLILMPLMSGYFAFILPAGVGVYWILSNIFSALQSYILSKVMNPKEMAEKARREMEEKKQRDREAKIEARKRARELGHEVDMAKSQKEINRIKLAQARRRDAEKYGDIYREVTDDDLKS